MDIVGIAFEKSMQKELDYRTEARRNITQFRQFYAKHTNFYIPQVYKEYSTKQGIGIGIYKRVQNYEYRTITSLGHRLPNKLRRRVCTST